MVVFKNRIRDLREDMDLRQIDVALATGIDQKTLSNYETGKTNPDSYSIIKLAEFFKVTTDYLLGYSNSNLSSNKDVIEKLDKIEKEIDEIKRFLK
ncbi:MAG: helix-turn-helix transcriptional regulator [Clostridia bacterium]|nr:helix-turn-helix transcriptional regulator [Clostridia bacterium]